MRTDPIELQGQRRRCFVECLSQIVQTAADLLDVGESCELVKLLRKRFPEIPASCSFKLPKWLNEGTALHPVPIFAWWAPTRQFWNDRDLCEFRKNVNKANQQLRRATVEGIRDTFLILEDAGGSLAPDPEAVAWGVGQFDAAELSSIRWIYFQVGEEVHGISKEGMFNQKCLGM